MNLTVSAEELAAEAAWMARLKPGNGFNTVTQSVEVTTLLGAIRLRRTDFDQFRETVISAEGAGQDVITVDATKLAALLKKAFGSAEISIDGSHLQITLANRVVRLRSTKHDVFPDWPRFKPTEEPSMVSGRQLARLLTSIGTDVDLPMLTVVSVEGGEMVATDRYRMTRIVYDESGFNALVPGAVLQPFAGSTDAITLVPGKDAGTDQPLVLASSGGRSVVAPIPDVQFPKWRQLIPETWDANVLLRRDDLIAAAQQGDNVVLTMKDNDMMQVTATDDNEDAEITQVLAVTTMEAPRSPLSVKLKSKYLIEGLRALGSGAVRLKANDPVKPIALEDVGSTDLHLIMPIKP
jgi:DNA polymerase-3 subunit beta